MSNLNQIKTAYAALVWQKSMRGIRIEKIEKLLNDKLNPIETY
ncbi:hypothetical protein [Bacillus paralicheniformis]|nr:hypothetical protein [Bacillus paralicheniformis]MEC1281023.1 hypothetical protein [Bacillus paralicheniformis]MEC1300645.1 hypothetical protein [Bacillus paralicheniformis]